MAQASRCAKERATRDLFEFHMNVHPAMVR